MLNLDRSDLLCLLEVLTTSLDDVDNFDAEQDYLHAEDLLRRVKKELEVPLA